jgi:hypothetical protein
MIQEEIDWCVVWNDVTAHMHLRNKKLSWKLNAINELWFVTYSSPIAKYSNDASTSWRKLIQAKR